MSSSEDTPAVPPPPTPPATFDTKEEAIQWMLDVNALRHKEAKTQKSDKKRVYFGCTQEDCEYAFHVSQGSDGVFLVTKW